MTNHEISWFIPTAKSIKKHQDFLLNASQCFKDLITSNTTHPEPVASPPAGAAAPF